MPMPNFLSMGFDAGPRPGLPQEPSLEASMEEWQRRRAMAQAMKNQDSSKIKSHSQGLAQMANALLGGIEDGRVDAEQRTARKEYRELIRDMLAGSPMDIRPSMPDGVGAAPASAPVPGMPPTGGKIYSNDEPSPLDPPQGADRDLMIRTMFAEAGNQPPAGQSAVANVIRNRAVAGNFGGDTVRGVIEKPWQFEPTMTPQGRANMASLRTDSPQYRQIGELADQAYTGANDPTGGATHFFAPKLQSDLGRNVPAWGRGPGQDIGDHRFFGGAQPPSKGAQPPGQLALAMMAGGAPGQQPPPSSMPSPDATIPGPAQPQEPPRLPMPPPPAPPQGPMAPMSQAGGAPLAPQPPPGGAQLPPQLPPGGAPPAAMPMPPPGAGPLQMPPPQQQMPPPMPPPQPQMPPAGAAAALGMPPMPPQALGPGPMPPQLQPPRPMPPIAVPENAGMRPSAPSAPPSAGPQPDRRALIMALMSNPYGQQLGMQMLAAEMQPKYGFQVAGDQLFQTNARDGRAVPVAGVSKPMNVPRDARLVNPQNGQVIIPAGPETAPAGYEWADSKNPTAGLKAISGGPATKLAGEQAGRLAMMKTAQVDFNAARKELERPWDTTDRAMAALGAGDIGRAQRVVSTALEAALRAMTGAAAPEAEVRRYKDMYMPGQTDTPQTAKQKLDLLAGFMNRASELIEQGHTQNPAASPAPAAGKPDPLGIR